LTSARCSVVGAGQCPAAERTAKQCHVEQCYWPVLSHSRRHVVDNWEGECWSAPVYISKTPLQQLLKI